MEQIQLTIILIGVISFEISIIVWSLIFWFKSKDLFMGVDNKK